MSESASQAGLPLGIIEGLVLLAAPASAQRDALPDWVAIPDEVGLTFLDAYEVLDTDALDHETSDLLRAVTAAVVTALDEDVVVAGDSGSDRLETSPAWAHVREAAEGALAVLGVTNRHPRPVDGFVQGRDLGLG